MTAGVHDSRMANDLTLDKLASLRYADIMICHDRVSVRVAKRTAYQYFSWSKPFSSETKGSVIEEAIDAACEAYRQEWLDPKPDQQ